MPSDSALDRLIRCPRLTEIDRIDLAASAAEVWNTVRHGEIAHSPAIRALFALRTIVSHEASTDASLRVDDLTSTPDRPGFQLLLDDPPREFAVGAIGKVWRLDIPFIHVATADEYAAFEAPGYVKVAWAVRVSDQGSGRSHLEIEVRVDATDDASWTRFRRYFRLIGPGSRFIRRSLVRALARRFGQQTPDPNRRPLPGDELLPDAGAQIMHQADLMESGQLRNPAMRAEGRLPATTWRDVWDAVSGASSIASALATPFMRRARSHWGIDAATAARRLPGDELVAEPAWSWTHGVEVDADAEEVWPWVAQVGADWGGFYSYQWLENLAGCRLRNAEVVHPEWEAREGQALVLHPDLPPMRIASIERGRFFVAHAGADAAVRAGVGPWVEASWLFLVEPIGAEPGGEARCRVLSRYRVTCSTDLRTRLFFGPTLVEPLGFAMDRRMLAGIKARAERSRKVLERQAVASGGQHV